MPSGIFGLLGSVLDSVFLTGLGVPWYDSISASISFFFLANNKSLWAFNLAALSYIDSLVFDWVIELAAVLLLLPLKSSLAMKLPLFLPPKAGKDLSTLVKAVVGSFFSALASS